MSKKLYYSHNIESNQTNSNLLWKTVKELLGKKNTVSNECFLINEQLITQPIQTPKAINEYYIDVGPNLAANIDSGDME